MDYEIRRGAKFSSQGIGQIACRGGILALNQHDQLTRLSEMTQKNLKSPHRHKILRQEIKNIGIHPNAGEPHNSRHKERSDQNKPPAGQLFHESGRQVGGHGAGNLFIDRRASCVEGERTFQDST